MPAVLLMGMPVQGKYMVMSTQFPCGGEKYRGSLWLLKAMLFSTLLWISARKISLAITTWVMHLLLLSLHHRAFWLFRAEIALHVRLMES